MVSTKEFVARLNRGLNGTQSSISLGSVECCSFFEVNDRVYFRNRQGQEVRGKIIRLNPKKALTGYDSESWNVPYLLLNHVDQETARMRLPRAERLHEVAIEIRQLMDKHGLKDWNFQFSPAKSWLGRCQYNEQLIKLSIRHAFALPVDDVTDTILHEIAHALAGHKVGHGPEWKAIAVRIGARPVRCYSTLDTEERKRQFEITKEMFQAGDKVQFEAHRQLHAGVIVRMNPKRAKVRSTGGEWLVPYNCLKRVQLS